MNVSDETAAGVLTLTARPSTIPRRARFDPNMKGSLGSTIGNIRFYHELKRASCLVQKSAKPIGPIQLAFPPGGLSCGLQLLRALKSSAPVKFAISRAGERASPWIRPLPWLRGIAVSSDPKPRGGSKRIAWGHADVGGTREVTSDTPS